MINVTRTWLPDFDEYAAILKRAWNKGWITNNGELVVELEEKLRGYLQVERLLFTSNGTVPLQMALKALNITGEVITTPFSYVATSNAIAWEGCQPVFADIDEETFTIDPLKIEEAITGKTQAIMATHVYGIPCNVEAIEAIAEKHRLKVIYDAAHAFGCTYNGRSLLNYGDISTCSFHATKIFHTVEGGCIVANNKALHEHLFSLRQFGHTYDEYEHVGINGKNSEFHAAMGLVILPVIDSLIAERKNLFDNYCRLLQGMPVQPLNRALKIPGLVWNYSYFPVVFETKEIMLAVKEALVKEDIHPRRYFHPALNTLPFYGPKQDCPVAESVSGRILCLPFFNGLSGQVQEQIVSIVKQIC